MKFVLGALVLKQELHILGRAFRHLSTLYNTCSSIPITSELDESKLVNFDALTSRFIRAYEVYTKQVLRTILQILGEYELTFIDNMNKAEKIGLVDRAILLSEARKLRNIISHEYQAEQWVDILQELMELIPKLLASKDQTLDYIYKNPNFDLDIASMI